MEGGEGGMEGGREGGKGKRISKWKKDTQILKS